MKRLLCILANMNAGGAETFLMKIYRQVDRTRYQMDFCINAKDKCFYEDEINALGGRIYRIPSKSENTMAFKKQLGAVVRDNGYDHVLRITSSAAGFMDLKIAKGAGAAVCCARSSNSSDGNTLKSRLVHRLGRLLYNRYVDVKIAPSDLAAAYTFGKRAYRNGDVHILHNAVDLNVFRYDPAARKRIRSALGITDDVTLVGHIGRFNTQKNHEFLLDIYDAIHKKNSSAKLMLVGNGTLENEIRAKVDRLGLNDSVIFTGVRNDVPELLSAMDVFVFPSFYEGMPNTVIEAQATGLPCVIADTITREADITGLVSYLSLSQSADAWALAALDRVNAERQDTGKLFRDRKYDIESVASQFTQMVFGD